MEPEGFSTEQIVAYVVEEADAATTERIRRAAEASAALRARIDDARTLLQTLETDDSDPVAPQLARRLLALFPRPSWLERVEAAVRDVATTIIDSWNQPALAGFRGVGAARQILCSGGNDVTIDLLARRVGVERDDDAADRWVIRGQATTPDGPVDARVGMRPLGHGELVGPDQTDRSGSFVLHAPPGRYELILEIGERALVIEDVVLDD